MKRSPFKSRPSRRQTAYAKELDAITPALMERADWRCEVQVPDVCIGGRLDPHHRIARSLGGPNTLWNLLAVCRACHGYIEHNVAESHVNGWLVKSWEDPGTTLVQSWRDLLAPRSLHSFEPTVPTSGGAAPRRSAARGRDTAVSPPGVLSADLDHDVAYETAYADFIATKGEL